MTKTIFTLLLWMGMAVAPINALAVTGSIYPSSVLKNQFGETSINSVIGGSMPDCTFTVAATDSAGNGITGLSGSACNAVYMHTSATPSASNPNPAAGYILVNLKSQFYGFLGGYVSLTSPNSGTPINVTSGTTAGLAYVITSLGDTSLSQWQHLGLPLGITPAVGSAFIAPTTTTATGTGAIQVPLSTGTGTFVLDSVGLPASSGQATAGSWIVLRALAATNSSTTTLAITAPAAGSVIGLHFVLLPLSSQLH